MIEIYYYIKKSFYYLINSKGEVIESGRMYFDQFKNWVENNSDFMILKLLGKEISYKRLKNEEIKNYINYLKGVYLNYLNRDIKKIKR